MPLKEQNDCFQKIWGAMADWPPTGYAYKPVACRGLVMPGATA